MDNKEVVQSESVDVSQNDYVSLDISIKKIKRKIFFWISFVMFFSITISQVFVYFVSTKYDANNADFMTRLAKVMELKVLILFVIFLTLTLILIFITLKPLFRYYKDGTLYDKARTASLKIPWILLFTQIFFWFLSVTAFFMLRDWELSSGYSHVMVYAQKISVGLVSSIISSQIINLILMKAKVGLNIQDIRKKENDKFTRYKDILIILSILFTFITYFSSLAYYYYTSEWGNLSISNFRITLILTSSLLSVFALTMVILSKKEYNVQISFMRDRVGDLARGGADLSKRVVMLTFDEIGEIARLINDFISHLDRDFRSLKDLVQETGRDADHVSESALSLSQRSKEQTLHMESITKTMERFSVIMEKVKSNVSRETEIIQMNASAAEELNRGIESISDQAHRVNKKTIQNMEAADKSIHIVNSSVESTLKMSDKMNEIAEKIKTVGDQSEQIDEIITTIQTIAENTDMLSMNAAIEAAHAGEAGVGFSIVAQEIRELAELSSQSARDISALVHDIKQSIIDAVAMSTMGEVEAEQGKKMAEEAGSALSSIVDNMKETNEMIGEISGVTGEQKNLSEHFLEGIESLSTFSNSIQSAIDEQALEAVQIDHDLQNLSQSNEENAVASDKLAKLSEDLKLLGNRLNIIVAQFQISEKNETSDPVELSDLPD